MNLVEKWRQHRRLELQQNLRTWLERLDLNALYNGSLPPGEVTCHIIQKDADQSAILLSCNDRGIVEVTCFHDQDLYRIELLVRSLNLRDETLAPEDHLMLTLFLLDELNGLHPCGALVNRLDGESAEINLCWTQTLPTATLQSEEALQHFLYKGIAKYLWEELVPELEYKLIEYVSYVRRDSEFHIEENEDDED